MLHWIFTPIRSAKTGELNRSALKETLMNLIFEWDEDKVRRNEAKHGVSFQEGKTVFNDPFAVMVPDPDHSEHEDRWLDIGFTSRGRLVVVWYIKRNDRIRKYA